MHNDDKAPLKEILIEEQGGICAYCMGRINAENSTIEHYIPRNGENGDPDKSLDYDNLFAVCNTTRNMPYEKQTCDVRKGGKLLYLDPRKQSDIDSIKYTKQGKIFSDNSVYDDDLNQVLNLNTKTLVKNRFAEYNLFTYVPHLLGGGHSVIQ